MVRSSRSSRFLADAIAPVGYCRRGANCWFRHVMDPNGKKRPEPTDEDELLCSICLDKPTTFGLLGTFHASYDHFETTNSGQVDVVTYSASKYASAAFKSHHLTEPAVSTSMAGSRKQIRRSSELLQHQKVSHVSCSLKVYHSQF